MTSPADGSGAHHLDVLVVGVANVDLVTTVQRLPGEGETAFGTDLVTLPGGKGLNQAIAVAAAGGTAALATKAGDDAWGHLLLAALRGAGVDTTAFTLVPGEATAAVLVHVPPSGDSAVTVTRTSTTMNSLDDVEAAGHLLAHAKVTVIQLEFDPAVVGRALAYASGTTIGVLTPPVPLRRQVLECLDLIVVNAAEAATLLGTGSLATTDESARWAAEELRRLGPRAAVITLGARGAVHADELGAAITPSPPSSVVDTTGAGDAFLGALALALARGSDLAAAVTHGVAAGAQAVERVGASQSPSGRVD